MGFGINGKGNEYGISRKEFRELKRDLKAEAKKQNIDFSRADMKELKSAIKTGDLGAHLDQVGKDMQGLMGLHLTGKVDGTEALTNAQTVKYIQAIVDTVDFGDGVDKAKVLTYIKNANIERIQGQTAEAENVISTLMTNNNVTDLFAYDTFSKL
ncbi:hypothetical protein IJZ97_00005, partial [bacterium]|nr:hypothetical protein [bacterium]